MKHRFPIGTQYWSRGKHPRLCTVVDHLTVRNIAGRVVSTHYTAQHEFLGQLIQDHNVVDTTIARGLLPEYRHLLTATPAEAEAELEHTVHTPGRLHFRENGDANSYALLDENGRWWMSLLMNGEQVTERRRANLVRMAAAWNACEGILTENLEDNMPFLELIQNYNRLVDSSRRERPKGQAMRDGQRHVMRPGPFLTKSERDKLSVTAHRVDADTPYVVLSLFPNTVGEVSLGMSDVLAEDLVARVKRALSILPTSK